MVLRLGLGLTNNNEVPWVAQFDTPPNIVTNYTGWISWKDKRIAQFKNNCPLTRGTTYYFSQTGDDTTGDGSEGSPFKTLAKAKALIDAAPTNVNIRFRFKRGDIWKETVGIDTDKDNITIDDYGTGNKPEFNAFTVDYLAVDDEWTLAAGNRYTLSETSDIAWIRETADKYGETRGTPLIRQSSAATVEATNNSWWYDASGDVLHINLSGDNPNDINLEAVISNTESGIDFSGNGCRAQNIIADGWGCHRTNTATQAEGIHNSSRGDDANLFIECESYYCSSHTMAHNAGGASGNAGGKSMFLDCKTGYTKFNGSANETLYNSFSFDGGQETWFVGCEATYGTLPSSDWDYATEKARAIACFSHTSGAVDANCALIVAYDITVKGGNATKAWRIGSFNHLPAVTGDDLTLCRSFVVDSIEEAHGSSHFATVGMSGNTVYYGNKEYKHPIHVNPLALTNVVENCYIINCYIEQDMTTVGNGAYAFYNTTITTGLDPTFVHSFIKLTNVSAVNSNRWGMDFDVRAVTSAVPGTGTSRDARMFNCILDIDGTHTINAYFLGLTNQATNIKGNAYHDVDQDAGHERGYDNDPAKVELANSVTFNVSDAALLEAGSTDLPTNLICSHDINGKARTVSTPDIGPTDFSS